MLQMRWQEEHAVLSIGEHHFEMTGGHGPNKELMQLRQDGRVLSAIDGNKSHSVACRREAHWHDRCPGAFEEPVEWHLGGDHDPIAGGFYGVAELVHCPVSEISFQSPEI